MSNALSVNKDNFDSEVIKSDKPVIVDFWAEWCGPCKALAPILDEIATEVAGAKVVKVNVDEASELAQQYGIRGIPTLIFFKDGEVKSKMKFVPRYGNLKIKHKNTPVEKLRLIEMDLRKTYTELKSISFEKLDSIGNIMNESKTKISIEDIHKLITGYKYKRFTDAIRALTTILKYKYFVKF